MIDVPDGRPTRFSTAVVLSVALAATASLGVAAGQFGRVAVAAVAGAVLAGTVRVAGTDRWRPLAALVVALALPAVGAVLVAGSAATVAAQLRDATPPGTVFLVVGAGVATFGATVTPRDALGRESLLASLSIGVTVLGVVLSALAGAVLLQFAPVARALVDAAAVGLDALLAPAPGQVHLGIWLLLVALAVQGVLAASRWLPVAALAGPRLDPDLRERAARADRLALFGAVGAAAVGLLLVVVEQIGAPYAGLPGAVHGGLAALTGAAPLRWLLVGLAVVSAAAVAFAWLLRRGYRATGGAVLAALAPYAAGLVLVWFVATSADRIVSTLLAALVARLPEGLSTTVADLAPSVVEFYGPTLLSLSALTAALVVALALLVALLLLVVSGLLPRRAAGPAVASTGVFTAAAFAGALGASLPVALVGVLASVLVWDAGEYGATLGLELGGRAATARTELVHAGGTVLVGCCTLVAALALLGLVRGLDTGRVPVVPALAAALVGAVFLAVASR